MTEANKMRDIRLEKTVINITVIGRARGKSLLTRSAARPGDAVAVTGHPGLSAAGLVVLCDRLMGD